MQSLHLASLRLLSCLTIAVTSSVSARAQTLVRSVTGPASNAQYGKACITVSDQNGDGFADLLIGAPGFNSQRGAILCLSGAYMAFGTGIQTLWSIIPAATPGDKFGYALAEIPDATGDGVKDFLVGRPGANNTTGGIRGAVDLVDGLSHGLVAQRGGVSGDELGRAIAVLSVNQIVVAAPGSLSSVNHVYVANATDMATSGLMPGLMHTSDPIKELGVSLAAGPDLNGDGLPEIIAGAPGSASSGGAVIVDLSNAVHSFDVQYVSPNPGERLGSSVDASHDYDGDGVVDIVAGAPNWLDSNGRQAGRAVVLSGARLVAQTPPYEIFTLTLGFSSPFFDYHFGAAVRASGDLNNDGVGDILVGAPDYTYVGSGGSINNAGLVSIFSGATGTHLASIAGSSTDRVGDSLAGALQDFEGDGFKEFVFAGSLSDAGGTDSGVVKCYRLFPLAPAIYCAGKLNSLGCTPSMSFSGSPKVISAVPFLATANNIINQKNGLLFYSHAPISIAFQGGLKCVASPTVRTQVQNSGGATSGASCTGTYSFDFNAWAQSGFDPSLVVGAEVFAQYWSRDPQSPSTTSLSNALRFVINP